MTRDELDPERDEELTRLLQRWAAPVVPEGMDDRVLAAWRRQVGREPWWSRLFTANVRVPVPVAVGVLMLLIVTAMLALRPVSSSPTAGTAGPSQPVQAARQSDVPVVSRTSLAGFQPVSEVTATVVTDQSETRQ